MCIVTGPRLELAITLIERMKGLFQYWREGFDNPHSPILRSQNGSSKHTIGQVHFDTKENVIVLNGVHIEAYPSHHLDAMRGIPNQTYPSYYSMRLIFFLQGNSRMLEMSRRDISLRVTHGS